MGTSSSGTGPRNKTSLLPNWAQTEPSSDGSNNDGDESPDQSDDSNSQDNQGGNQNDNPQTGNWTDARRSFGRFLSKGNKSGLKKAARSYVRSSGGAKNATRASSRGIAVASGYLSFLGSVQRLGNEQALVNLGLEDCIGKTSEEVFVRLIDRLAPIGSTNEQAIARKALVEAMTTLYDRYVADGRDIEGLNNLTEENLRESLCEYVTEFIYYKWLYELGVAIEKKDISETEAINLEKQIHEFIHAEVKIETDSVDIKDLDFEAGKGKDIITKVFELAYSTLEK